MKKIIFSFSFLVMCLFIHSLSAQSLIWSEPFNYPVGDSLTGHGWLVQSTGVNTILVKNGSLNYNQYPASTGNSAYIKNTGQDVNHTFAGQNSGSVYVSALVKFDSASTNGEYIMHFIRSGTNYNERVYVRKSTVDATQISFGIVKGTTNVVYTTNTYPIDSTYLLVLKYKFISGATNDSVFLYVNPAIAEEGTPTLKATDVISTDLDSAYTIALRQGSTTNSTYYTVDEIRVANSWYNAVGYYVVPQVQTLSYSNLTPVSATCNGNIISNGGLSLTARGICYDTLVNPTLTNLFTTEPIGSGSFTSNLSGLIAGKTYHYRAYATNSLGTTYGADSTFTTGTTAVAPIVSTSAATTVYFATATVNGNVISDGGANITARGFCYSTVANPSLTDSVRTVSGTTGSMNYGLTGLTPNTLYHVRAYATNSAGTAYGADISFTTQPFIPTYTIAQVHTENATTGAADSLNVNCKLLGVVHGINFKATTTFAGYNFFIEDPSGGINVYKTTLVGYTPNQGDSIKVIGKIAQVNGLTEIAPDSIVFISSGNALHTPLVVNTLDETTESILITKNNLTYISGWPVTAGNAATILATNGIDTTTIYVNTNCTIQGTPIPTATFNVTGLGSQNDATSPYFQSYRIIPRSTTDISINYVLPTVLTTSTNTITMTSATCNGNVTTNGGSAIMQRGICYGTTANPDTIGTHMSVSGTTGVFSANLTGLTSGTLYHYRAYALNSTGLAYGADSTFTTSATPVLPVVSTDSVYSITPFTANAAAKVINDGGGTITARGVCWSLVANPTLTDSINTQTGTIGAFIGSLTNLSSATLYHVRAYATNSNGTAYGNDLTFTTKIFVPTYTISQIHTENATTGAADSLNVNCKLLGVVHGINFKATTTFAGYNFFIEDPSGGINVYKTTLLSYTPAQGDSIRVIGKIAQVNGLTEINPDSIVLISAANALHTPITVTTLDETTESKLITKNNLTYMSGWPVTAGNSATVLASNGIDTTTIYINTNCTIQGTPAPTTTFNVTGLGSQNDATSPYFQSYRIIPRNIADITINYAAPTVLTTSTTAITMTSASCSGNVTSTGGYAITQRGVCYGTTANPDTIGTHIAVTGTTGVFSANLAGLTSGTLYHYRAYALNSFGLAYGADSTFTTSSTPVLPVVSTDSVYNITSFTANAAAKVINDGGGTITARGVCWSLVANPTLTDSINTQTGTIGAFIGSLANLSSSTLYHVRAFATNSSGTAYGNDLTFTTKLFIPTYTIAQVHTENATTGAADSLTVNCKLIGVVHSINFKATTTFAGYNFYILDPTGGINVYKTTLVGYTPAQGDSIRVIGKIAQVNGLTEMNPDSIVLISAANALHTPITVTTLDETTESKLITKNNLTYISGWPVTAGNSVSVLATNGIDTTTIYINTNCTIQGTPAPTVTFSITGLGSQNDATSPYFNAYRILPRNLADLAINYTNPNVITGTHSGVTQYTALCNGNVTTDGGHALTARGICYSTNANPTIADSIRTTTAAVGTYSINLTNLTLSTTYHYRAYCINSLGTFYGNDSTFITAASAVVPVLTTGAATAITFTGATVSGTVVNDGGDTVITRGICWGLNHNPTLTDSFSVATATATFSSTLSNLTNYTTYYARAYATNAVGVGYGNEITFNTLRLPPLYTISQVHTENATSGIADSLNVNCKLLGVVHSINYKQTTTSTALNFYIMDNTGGINVYKTTNLGYAPVEGDSLRVIGKIAQVSGLTEMVPDSIVLISSGNALHTPLIVSAFSESNEAYLVTMNNLTYLSGWPTTAGNTVTVLALNGVDTITMRFYSNCTLQGTPAPTSNFNMTGMVGQIDVSNPYLSNYILIPRDINDLFVNTSIEDYKTDNGFVLYPNPSNGKVNISLKNAMDAEIKVYSLLGNVILRKETNQSFVSFDMSDYERGVYFVSVRKKNNNQTYTTKLIVQ